MIKTPLNTKVIFTLYRDFTSMGFDYSEEIIKSEVKAEVMKEAKQLGEDQIWHVMETKVVACSDAAHQQRQTRLEPTT